MGIKNYQMLLSTFVEKLPITIPNDDREKCIDDVEKLIKIGEWVRECPAYQTKPVLLDIKSNHWQNLKTNIETIVTNFYKKPEYFKCWAYVNFVGVETEPGYKWHCHNNVVNKLSCIVYLQCEDPCNGTMFDVGNMILMPKVDENSIFIYNSTLVHSPSAWDYKNSTKNRIVLAMDAYFDKME